MKNIVNEFKGIIWPSKKRVWQEFWIVILFSIIGMLFISLINLGMSQIFTYIN